jgi:ankyrin repeat protein
MTRRPQFSAARLIGAAKRGDIGGLRAELAQAPAPDSGRFLVALGHGLMEAAKRDQALALHYLLDAGAQIDFAGGAALTEAIKRGNVQAIEALLARGARLEETELARDCLLCAAARKGKLAAVRALLDAGLGLHKDVALSWAGYREDGAEMVDLLLERGADPNGLNGTILGVAVLRGNASAAAALVARGARDDKLASWEREKLGRLIEKARNPLSEKSLK